jgi:hypothetical protein
MLSRRWPAETFVAARKFLLVLLWFVAARKPVLFLSYRIKKLEIFYF